MTNQTDISVFREWWQHTFGKWLNVFVYWKARRAILADPTITLSPRSKKLKIESFRFALQSIFLVPLFTSIITWSLQSFSELPPTPLEKVIEQVDETSQWPPDYEPLFGIETHKTRYETTMMVKRGYEILLNTIPVIISLAIVMVASLFRFFLKNWQDSFPLVKQADRVYLYCVGARLFIPVTLFSLFGYIADLLTRYSLSTVTDIHEYHTFGSQPWLLTRQIISLLLITWMLVALWKSTADISNSLQLEGKKNARRAVAIRLFSAQFITLFVFNIAYVSVLILYLMVNA